MRRLFFFFFLFVAVGALLIYKIHQDSGYILIVLGSTSIEMSLWFGIAVVIALWFVCWLVLKILRGGLGSVISVKQSIESYSSRKAQQKTMEGLVHFIEGDWVPAYKKLTRSLNKSASPMVNYLAAARCAYETGNEQNALELLHQAEQSADNSGLAVALTQARMQLSNQQYEQALATLERVSKSKPNHDVVLNLQRQVYLALKDWPSLSLLLPKLRRQNIGTAEERYLLEKTLHKEILIETIAKLSETSTSDTATDKKYAQLKQCWEDIPKKFHQDDELLHCYGTALVTLKEYDAAATLWLTALSQIWSNHWVEQYGLVTTSRPDSALVKAEKWLKIQPNNSVLLLALGRLCLQNKQWGRAREFLTQSIDIHPTAEAYAELARLQQFLGDKAKSLESSKQGLLVLTKPLVVVGDFE